MITLQSYQYLSGVLQAKDSWEFPDESALLIYLNSHYNTMLVNLALANVYRIKLSHSSQLLSGKISSLFNLQNWLKSVPDETIAMVLYYHYPQLFIDRAATICLANPGNVRLLSGNHLVKTLPSPILKSIETKSFTVTALINKRKWYQASMEDSWQAIFKTRRKTSVEQITYSLGLKCHWNSGNLLLSKQIAPLISNQTSGQSSIMNLMSTDADESIIEIFQNSILESGESVSLLDNEILLFNNQCYVHNHE